MSKPPLRRAFGTAWAINRELSAGQRLLSHRAEHL